MENMKSVYVKLKFIIWMSLMSFLSLLLAKNDKNEKDDTMYFPKKHFLNLLGAKGCFGRILLVTTITSVILVGNTF